jgi:formylglycine-generating enzyme required for sulfatase activity
MERAASEAAAFAFAELDDAVVRFPASVFQLGARLDDLPRALHAIDLRQRLALGTLLRATPPRWVYLPEFAIASRPVTNGEYLRFMEDPGYEDPGRWQRVFEDHAIDHVDHYAIQEGQGDVGRLRKTWESYAGVRSFLLAFLRSVIFECERELDLSPRFADTKSVWDEARAVDRPRAAELAQVTALVARALAPALPGDFRRELAPDERERLATLDAEAQVKQAVQQTARQRALEALDAVVGRLRDRYLDALRKEGSARVAPEFERGLVERDYGATDLQIVALKFLDRVRAAHARDEIPLRRILYPLTWPSEDPRIQSRERPDRLAWADQPVTGISLYEALAYADWVGRGAGERALVRLPSEAQLERAASWPVLPAEARPDGGVRETVDPRWKLLFPWERRSEDDPGALAGDEPVRTPKELFSELDRSPFELELAAFRELVRQTTRVVGERRIEMLLGFQWEWTRDRLSELEPAYEQLERAEPLGREHEAYERGKNRPVPATHYCASSRRGPWFAVRGAPPRTGGCALATRRYGLYPLRGVPDCGFRLVVEPSRQPAAGARA